MKILIEIAFRNIFRHKMRSLATFAAISFGVGSLIFSGGFFEDLFIKIRENNIYSGTGHIQITKQGFREFGNVEPFDFMVDSPNDIIAALKTIPGGRYFSPEIYFGGFLSDGERSVACLATGIDSEASFPVQSQMDRSAARGILGSGRLLLRGESVSNDAPADIELGFLLAKNYGAEVGDELIFLNRTADGSINGQDVRVRGIFSTGIDELDRLTIKMPLKTAQNLIRTGAVHAIVSYLDKTERTDEFVSALKKRLPESAAQLEIKTWREDNDFYWKTKALFGMWAHVVKLIISILIVLIIFNTMNMAIFERTGEIGTVRALGSKRDKVVGLLVWEGFFLGLMGGAGGAILGIFLTVVARHIGIPMPEAPGFTVGWISEPVIVWSEVAASVLLAVVAAVFSSYWPAKRAAALDIATALRRSG